MKNIITTTGYILELSKEPIKNNDWVLDVGILKNTVRKADVDEILGIWCSGRCIKIIAHKPLKGNPFLENCKILKQD